MQYVADAVHVCRFESFVSRFAVNGLCKRCVFVWFLCVISFSFFLSLFCSTFSIARCILCVIGITVWISQSSFVLFSIYYSIGSAVAALLKLLAIGVFDTIDAKGRMNCTFLIFRTEQTILFVLFCSEFICPCGGGVADARVLKKHHIDCYADCAVFFSHTTIWSDGDFSGKTVFAQRRSAKKK